VGRRMSERSIESTVNQLVEALHDRAAAQAELDRFNTTYRPPIPPVEFANLRAFLDFHRLQRDYEDAVAEREKNLATTEERYTQAAHRLREVLPEDVLLHHEYMGRRRNLLGTRYVIVNTEGEVKVTVVS
jgi:hypothetical protein